MPKDSSIRRALIIGSGPIVIGQACEFDYSGTQACRALKEEGIAVVLLNSNPATIMTDPELADRTYIEPILPEVIDDILGIEAARGTPIDVILPTLGGQTGLNCAMEASERGILEKHNVRLIGANRETIARAEDRQLFKETMVAAGIGLPRSGIAHTWEEALAVLEEVKLPACIRPAYTLGGAGGGMARTPEQFETIVRDGLSQSRISEVLIEEDLTGWKEFELEMMRDRRDNVVVVCSIENLDPMGVHTGDSITVAPALTLTDREYQDMRDDAIRIIRAVGVETGGSNIQFGVDPKTGRRVVIEMNPRVSRSSALASKATGFPIAKIATKLAIGYTLDEIRNDITRETPACFEPAIDYCVVKIPRFAFEKFPDADETLTTAMKSVGEGMAIGRTFKEAFQKCIRSMEIRRPGYGLHANDKWLESLVPDVPREGAEMSIWFDAFGHEAAPPHNLVIGSTLGEAPVDWKEQASRTWPLSDAVLTAKIGTPCQGRIYYIRYALKLGWSVERVHTLSGIDPWFLDQMNELIDFENELLRTRVGVGATFDSEFAECYAQAKRLGYSDAQLRAIWRLDAGMMQHIRRALDNPTYKLVDTCAGEFEAYTPYYYSTHEQPVATVIPGTFSRHQNRGFAELKAQAKSLGISNPHRMLLGEDFAVVEHHEGELKVTDRPKVIVLGGGPNRIGQGIEFDYCCVHAAQTARELGFETVMVNSNPETVSTDYDVSDLLFFEPLTHEDVLNICERLNGGPFKYSSLQFQLEPRYRLQPAAERPLISKWERSGLGAGIAIARIGNDDIAADPGRGYRVVTADGRLWDLAQGRSMDVALVPSDAASLATELKDLAARARRELARSTELVRGVIVQYGGQTPLNLAQGLLDAGVPILGTSPASIHLAEDRERFGEIIRECGLRQPPNGIAFSGPEAIAVAERLDYPVLVRPSYVLGGRGMQICNNRGDLERYIDAALGATDRQLEIDRQHPILVDKFLLDAVEVDVDAVSDYGYPGRDVADGRCDICGIMEHIEEAGIHSGDSCCVLPPYSLSPSLIDEIKHQVKVLARRLGVCGLMNVQFAIQGRVVYVIEVNPRASRTIPFVSKATGVPWAKIATQVMLGRSLDEALAEAGIRDVQLPKHVSVKAPVFPFRKFRGVDCVLGPEMRSTGEVMGIDPEYPRAFAKALLGAGVRLPTGGRVLVSVCDPDKPRVVSIARELHEMGFEIFSTVKTHQALADSGVPSTIVSKHAGQEHPFLLDLIVGGKLDLLINTPIHTGSASEEGRWRAASVQRGVPLITTLAGARAAVGAIRALRAGALTPRALQDYLAGKR